MPSSWDVSRKANPTMVLYLYERSSRERVRIREEPRSGCGKEARQDTSDQQLRYSQGHARTLARKHDTPAYKSAAWMARERDTPGMHPAGKVGGKEIRGGVRRNANLPELKSELQLLS